MTNWECFYSFISIWIFQRTAVTWSLNPDFESWYFKEWPLQACSYTCLNHVFAVKLLQSQILLIFPAYWRYVHVHLLMKTKRKILFEYSCEPLYFNRHLEKWYFLLGKYMNENKRRNRKVYREITTPSLLRNKVPFWSLNEYMCSCGQVYRV